MPTSEVLLDSSTLRTDTTRKTLLFSQDSTPTRSPRRSLRRIPPSLAPWELTSSVCTLSRKGNPAAFSPISLNGYYQGAPLLTTALQDHIDCIPLVGNSDVVMCSQAHCLE